MPNNQIFQYHLNISLQLESVAHALTAKQELLKYYSSAEGNHTETLSRLEKSQAVCVKKLGGLENAKVALDNITEAALSIEKLVDEEDFADYEVFRRLCIGEKVQKVGL